MAGSELAPFVSPPDDTVSIKAAKLFIEKSINASFIFTFVHFECVCVPGDYLNAFLRSFYACIIGRLCTDADSCLLLTNVIGLCCSRTLLLHCVLPTLIISPLISRLPLEKHPVSRAQQWSGPSSHPVTPTGNKSELDSQGSPIRPS